MAEIRHEADAEADRLRASALWDSSFRHLQNGDVEAARSGLEQLLSIEPDNPLAWVKLADLEACSGHPDKAVSCCARALKLRLDPFVIYQAGLVQEYLSRWESAENHFSLAISRFERLKPRHPLFSFIAEANAHLGWARWNVGNRSDAAADIEAALAANENCSHAHLFKGLTQADPSGAGAKAEIDRAAELTPEDPFVRAFRGRYYRDVLKDTDTAAAEFRLAKRIDPMHGAFFSL